MASTKAPVVFIHGLWLHASSWAPWQELLGEAGYESSAPGWPGDANSVEATAPTRTASPITASTTLPITTRASSMACQPSRS